MIGAGLLLDQHVELLDGEIYEMTPIGPPHQSVVDRLNDLLMATFGKRVIVRVQGPVPPRRRSEPQPNIAAQAPGGRLPEGPSRGGERASVIEVADSCFPTSRLPSTTCSAERPGSSDGFPPHSCYAGGGSNYSTTIRPPSCVILPGMSA